MITVERLTPNCSAILFTRQPIRNRPPMMSRMGVGDGLVGRGTFEPREPYLHILIHWVVLCLV